MAQVYNHVIMPLANERDKHHADSLGHCRLREPLWGAAEGMWLSETAVDSETLELLAQHGIKFTLLAPHQCKRIRPLKEIRDGAGCSVDHAAGQFCGYDTSVPDAFRLRRVHRCLLL